MTLSHWQRQEQGPTMHCDIAIVGGGIIGTSTAYWLKKSTPDSRVVLIESETLGYGASGRNAGFLLQGAAVDYATDVSRYGKERARLLWAFTMENRALIESELDAAKIGLQGGGSLLLAGTEEEAARLRTSAEMLEELGERANYWSTAEISSRLKGVGFFGGLHVQRGGRVDSLKLLREIAGRSGAIILEGHPVFSVESDADGVLLHTRRRKIIAGRVFFCLNAYLPLLLPETEPLIRPVRAQMMSTHPVEKWLEYPIYSHDGYFYIRQLESGALLVGGARHKYADEEVGYEDQTTEHLQKSLRDYLLRHFPHLERVEPEHQWSGVMGFTPDGLPIIAPVDLASGCYWAAGFNGHGMGYGFRFGKLLADIASGTQNEKEYRALFDISRMHHN